MNTISPTSVLVLGMRLGFILGEADLSGAILWYGHWGCPVPWNLQERLKFAQTQLPRRRCNWCRTEVANDGSLYCDLCEQERTLLYDEKNGSV